MYRRTLSLKLFFWDTGPPATRVGSRAWPQPNYRACWHGCLLRERRIAWQSESCSKAFRCMSGHLELFGARFPHYTHDLRRLDEAFWPQHLTKHENMGSDQECPVSKRRVNNTRLVPWYYLYTGFIAQKLCPELTIVPIHMSRYSEMSKIIMNIFRQYDPDLLAASVDEAYLK